MLKKKNLKRQNCYTCAFICNFPIMTRSEGKRKKKNQVKETQEITDSPLAEFRMDLDVFKFRYIINAVSQDHCVEFFLLHE